VTARVGLLLLALSLGACAAAPRVMQYYPEGGAQAGVPSWPAAPAVPRLEFAGELLGEQNFVLANNDQGAGRGFLRWLVGLSRRGRQVTQLVRPQSGVVDAQGRILVTDAGRPSIFVFDEAAGSFDVWREAEAGVDFVSPVGIAELNADEFIVADAELAGAFVLSREGVPLRRFGATELERPTGLDVDTVAGRVYIADKGARLVKVFSTAGTLLRTIGVPGDAAGTLNAPMHIHVVGDRLYVSDALNAHVLTYAADSGELLGQVGQRGLYVGNMVRPKGVSVDSDGNIYVVESYYDHLLVYDDAGRFLLPVGGTGSDVGKFFLPAGAWSDRQDRIFIADMFNSRVVIFRYVGAES